MKWVVSLDGYMPEVFEAETLSKARYRAYLQFKSAWPCTFREFPSRCHSVRQLEEGEVVL